VAAFALFGSGALAILLWLAGLSWATTDALTIFGSLDRLTGPFGLSLAWWDRLPEIAAALGAVAAALALRAHAAPRWLTAAITAVLALGAAFLVAWLIDPPAAAIGAGRAATDFSWPAYAATAAVAVAAVCGLWLTARRPAT
jgi:hypothetical protein